jgi:hypothetical protein
LHVEAADGSLPEVTRTAVFIQEDLRLVEVVISSLRERRHPAYKQAE